MGKVKDITNKRFGRLIALEHIGSNERGDSLWRCICDCGNYAEVTGGNLRSSTSSCGCIKNLPKSENAFNKLYRNYGYNSTRRGLEFLLTREEFRKLTEGDCHYCGAKPFNKTYPGSKQGDYVYSGVDRIDSKKEYILENCVSCCKYCNMAKSTRSYDDYINWIKQSYSHLNR